jgi:hypothetical protein
MTIPRRVSLRRPFVLLLLVSGACRAEEGDLEQHAAACEQRCSAAQMECADDPAFADPWALSCEVACNLDFNDEAKPFLACLDAADACDDKDACVSPGSAWSGGGSGSGDDGGDTIPAPATTQADDDDDDDDDDDGADDDTGPVDATVGDSSGGTFDGPPCCDVSGASACTDPAVLECTCQHMPACCSGTWGEACTSVAVANGCLADGCETLEAWTEYQCSCSTIDVYCPEDPFVGQIIFGTDACGLSETDALAIATAACEQGDGDCRIGAGSCACQCNDFGDTCGPR